MPSPTPTRWEQGRAVFRAELLGLLRDRLALFSAVVLPVLLYPLLFFGQRWLEQLSREISDCGISPNFSLYICHEM